MNDLKLQDQFSRNSIHKIEGIDIIYRVLDENGIKNLMEETQRLMGSNK